VEAVAQELLAIALVVVEIHEASHRKKRTYKKKGNWNERLMKGKGGADTEHLQRRGWNLLREPKSHARHRPAIKPQLR
jgi:hypothetical protein